MVKGITYKEGQVPTMMIAKASMANWKDSSAKESDKIPVAKNSSAAKDSTV